MKKNIIYIIFALALIKAAFFSRFGFGLVDQGESLHNAQRILMGDLPYRDFFAIFPPVDNYFYATVFYIFGDSVFIPRLISSFIFAFTPVLTFVILKRFLPLIYALIPAFLVIFIDVNVERLFFFSPVVAGLYFLLQGARGRDRSKFLLAGLFLGLASLVRLDISGTYLFGFALALAAYLNTIDKKKWFKNWLTHTLNLGIGFLLPVGISLLWMIERGILSDFYLHAFIKSVEITKLHSLPFPSLSNLIPENFTSLKLSESYEALFGYSLLMTYAVTAGHILKKGKMFFKKNLELTVFLFSGIFALPYVFGRSDMGHLIKGGLPFLFLGTNLLHKVIQSKKSQLKLGLLALVFLIFIANIVQSLWWIRFNDQRIFINRNLLHLNSNYLVNSTIPSATTVKKSVDFLRSNSKENEPVLILPYMAGLYYLAERPSATDFNNVLAGFITTKEGQEDFIQKVEEIGVKVAVYDPINGPKMKTPQMQDYNPFIHEYVMDNFEIVEETEEGWLLMIRK